MKNLILAVMLVMSLTTTAQLSHSNPLDSTIFDTITVDILLDMNPTTEVAEDETFDFNTKDYLPIGFNPYNENLYDSIEEVIVEEEEVPFEFDTRDYLPLGFNPYHENFYDEIFDASIEEEIEPLDFDHYQYLPNNFDPYKGIPHQIVTTM